MTLRALAVVLAVAAVVQALSCARADDARAPTTVDAGAAASATASGIPRLPMPQQFPHFVWDAGDAGDASPR